MPPSVGSDDSCEFFDICDHLSNDSNVHIQSCRNKIFSQSQEMVEHTEKQTNRKTNKQTD